MRTLLLLSLVAVLLGAKACAIHVPYAAWYGTWQVPARFYLENGTRDQVCDDDVFVNGGDPLATFSGVPEWLDGDATTATAPAQFAVNGIGAGGVFRATHSAFFDTYHFEGVAFVDRAACARGERCEYFAFNAMPGFPYAIAYEVTSGWHDGAGHVCTNHFTNVNLDSTYCGGDPHPGCTDHQPVGWIPHLSNATINPCDWRPEICFVGNMDSNGDCVTPGAPNPEDNNTCCSCAWMPAGSVAP